MGIKKGVAHYDNPDGTRLKVETYNDKIVVRHDQGEGFPKEERTTDWFDNQVHVHEKDGSARWEGIHPEDLEREKQREISNNQ